jgi:hypothetical protein
MKALIKKYYQETKMGFFLFKPVQLIHHFFLMKKYLSPKAFIKQEFKKKMGYELDLDNPVTLNEKINWLKLNLENPVTTTLADKFAVRQFIEDTIGKQYLVPLFYDTRNVEDLKPENLPDKPLIIKTNHNSSGGILVKDKNDPSINWAKIRGILRFNLSQNYYWDGREKQYRNIIPRIIVEKLLLNKAGNTPNDYKVHCFNGKVQLISVYSGRFSGNLTNNLYNKNWEREPYVWSGLKTDDVHSDSSVNDVEKPKNLDLIIELSEKLSRNFDYLRVDWYILGEMLYFGEITFHHFGGLAKIRPFEWDVKLGKRLKLSAK